MARFFCPESESEPDEIGLWQGMQSMGAACHRVLPANADSDWINPLFRGMCQGRKSGNVEKAEKRSLACHWQKPIGQGE